MIIQKKQVTSALSKFLLVTGLSLVTFISATATNVFANTVNASNASDNIVVIYRDESDIEADFAAQKAILLGGRNRNATGNSFRTVRSNSSIVSSGMRVVPGQSSHGVIFNTGGSFNWQPGSNNISVATGLNWGPASFGIAFGRIGSGINSLSINVPQRLYGVPVWLHMNVSYEFRQYRVYTRPLAMPNVGYQFSHTMVMNSLAGRAFDVRNHG